MDGLRVLNTQNCDIVAGNINKGQKLSKVSKMGSPARKTLADISNLQQPSKPSNQNLKSPKALPFSTKDYFEKLHMENMTLVKVLAERNKIIELSGVELQKLRINLQKLQQQNSQLAQANSQMLAELNSGKDRLKALNHELGCKNGLLKARKVMSESKAETVIALACGDQAGADKFDDAGKIVEADDGNNNTCKTKRRRQSQNQSSISSTVKLIPAEEKVDNKRLSLRRQSARFKFEEAEPMDDRLPLRRQSARFKCEEPELAKDRICLIRQSARLRSEETEPEPVEDLYELDDDDNFPVSPLRDSVVRESGPTSDTLVQEEHREGNDALKDEAQESRRRSTGRPSRRAAEKVQSYKEITLKVKMRRE
ncbi:hypothetical protein Ddye_028893 [Dipteronia dyeriana]|uniref:Shugoshin C-terminal domain-containing protein n=1 Tax=Dipteronia dyeriana TaxID=168575 RepID=A0AAD9TE83_9ROSI|nr:hypothetical protein Ddye_028893 [Dipteronia dyeriana]